MNMPSVTLRRDEEAILALRACYERSGYTKYKMSKFEEYDFYTRNKSFLPSERILTFTDLSGRLMALKPDVTLSIVKNAGSAPEGTTKVYYNENVYRAAPGASVFSEITQVGLECIGQVDTYAMGEVLWLAARSLELLGDRYIMDVSHIGVAGGLLAAAGADEAASRRLSERMAAKNAPELLRLCRELGIDGDTAGRLSELTGLYGPLEDTIGEARRICGGADASEAALNELADACRVMELLGGGQNVNLDFSMMNDMNYYSGIILQGFIEGIPREVLSGGRYDNLLRRMGRSGGAIGFAADLSALEQYERADSPYDADVLISYRENTPPERVAEAVKREMSAGKSVRTEPKGGGARCRETLEL